MLTTIGATMGTALPRARACSTRRSGLLKETEARNAELAVINSIQQAVGAALDFQAIVDTVGDKLRECLALATSSIRWWDEPANAMHWLYAYEHGQRLNNPSYSPSPRGVRGLRASGGSITWARWPSRRQRRIRLVAGTDAAPSSVDRAHRGRGADTGPVDAGEPRAASTPTARPTSATVSTVASSMGVAMLNAKSYEAERQRAAELAVINSVPAGIARPPGFQGIDATWWATLRGGASPGPRHPLGRPKDKDRPAGGLYVPERGVRLNLPPTGRPAGGAGIVTAPSWRRPGSGLPGPARAALDPIRSGDRERMVADISLERTTSATTRSAAERQVPLRTVASSDGAALENAAAVRRDAAPAEGDRATQRNPR